MTTFYLFMFKVLGADDGSEQGCFPDIVEDCIWPHTSFSDHGPLILQSWSWLCGALDTFFTGRAAACDGHGLLLDDALRDDVYRQGNRVRFCGECDERSYLSVRNDRPNQRTLYSPTHRRSRFGTISRNRCCCASLHPQIHSTCSPTRLME